MRKVLSLLDLAVLASAAMGPAFSIASSLGPMIAAAGSATLWALLATGVVMLLTAIVFAELAAARPDAGSSYAWVRLAFGERWGRYTAWILLVSNFLAVVAIALPAGTYTLALVAPALHDALLPTALIGIAWVLVCSWSLALGARPTALASAVLLAIELVVIALAAFAAATHPLAALPNAGGYPPPTLSGFAAAMVLAIWLTDGWEVTASASEEATGGSRVPGRAGIIGLSATVALVAVATAAFMRIGDGAGIAAHSTGVFDYLAQRLGGGAWAPLFDAVVLVSLAATLASTMLYLNRSVYAMGRDGVLPAALGRLSKHGNPVVALTVVTVASVVAMLAIGVFPTLNAAFAAVLSGTSFFLGLLFLGSVLAALRLFPRPGPRALSAVTGVLLAAVLAIDVGSADAPTKAIAVGGLLLGVPLAFVSKRTMPTQVRRPEIGNTPG